MEKKRSKTNTNVTLSANKSINHFFRGLKNYHKPPAPITKIQEQHQDVLRRDDRYVYFGSKSKYRTQTSTAERDDVFALDENAASGKVMALKESKHREGSFPPPPAVWILCLIISWFRDLQVRFNCIALRKKSAKYHRSTFHTNIYFYNIISNTRISI